MRYLASLAITASNPVAVYQTIRMLEGVERPLDWKHWGEGSGRRLAWKTGTSYGFRDAWAVGTDGRWLVLAWTGNASNEGRPGVIGVETAAPLLFRMFARLPAAAEFFEEPLDDAQPTLQCVQSGYAAGPYCADTDTTWIGNEPLNTCPYCSPVLLDETGKYRVNHSCYPGVANRTTWMILTPAMAWYAERTGAGYAALPPWLPDCSGQAEQSLQWVYPESREVVRLTRDLDGAVGPVVLQAGHRLSRAAVFWYIDEVYQGRTTGHHDLTVWLDPGDHTLMVVDEQGNQAVCRITAVE